MSQMHGTGLAEADVSRPAQTNLLEPGVAAMLGFVSEPVAVLDGLGEVLGVSAAWPMGAGVDASEPPPCATGENYLDWIDEIADPDLGAGFRGAARRVLSGRLRAWEGPVAVSTAEGLRDIWVRLRRMDGLRPARFLVAHRPERDLAYGEFDARIVEARCDERRRVAADLHDSVGQIFVSLGLSVSRLQRLGPHSPDIDRLVREMTRDVASGHAEIRTISYLMHPPVPEETGALGTSVREFVAGFARRAGLDSKVEVSGSLEGVDALRQTTIFRVLQEALVNVHRHAHAGEVRVKLKLRGHLLTLVVQDDGAGMAAPEGEEPMRGVGLRSILSRVRELGGELRVLAGPDGTTLTATFGAVAPMPEPTR